jgi:hypothetical protein
MTEYSSKIYKKNVEKINYMVVRSVALTTRDLHPQKLALTSTSGGRSVGVILLRTKATEFRFCFVEKINCS